MNVLINFCLVLEASLVNRMIECFKLCVRHDKCQSFNLAPPPPGIPAPIFCQLVAVHPDDTTQVMPSETFENWALVKVSFIFE